MNMLLHICTVQAWREAQERGDYRAYSLESEGYIHCSTPPQVVKTANRFYPGQRDLVLLVIDSERVMPEIKYESADADVFPHLYGPLNLEAVVKVMPFAPTEEGTFELPSLV